MNKSIDLLTTHQRQILSFIGQICFFYASVLVKIVF